MFAVTIAAAQIEHLNVRKEGDEDDRIPAIDIKACGVTDAAVLNRLLGVSPGEGPRTALWDKDGRARFLGLGECGVLGKVRQCQVTIGNLKIPACDVGKFRFQVLDQHRVELTCSITRVAPGKGMTEAIAELVKESTSLVIEGPPELDLDNTAGGRAEQKPLNGTLELPGGGTLEVALTEGPTRAVVKPQRSRSRPSAPPPAPRKKKGRAKK